MLRVFVHPFNVKLLTLKCFEFSSYLCEGNETWVSNSYPVSLYPENAVFQQILIKALAGASCERGESPLVVTQELWLQTTWQASRVRAVECRGWDVEYSTLFRNHVTESFLLGHAVKFVFAIWNISILPYTWPNSQSLSREKRWIDDSACSFTITMRHVFVVCQKQALQSQWVSLTAKRNI